MSDYSNIEAKSITNQIDEAKSIYLFDGWYLLSDLERMIVEARNGARLVKPASKDVVVKQAIMLERERIAKRLDDEGWTYGAALIREMD